jgi:hypothetical protein
MKMRQLYQFASAKVLFLADRALLLISGVNSRLSHQLLVLGRVGKA